MSLSCSHQWTSVKRGHGTYPEGMTTPTNKPRYLTRKEVADIKGVTLRTVKRWMDTGRLHYERDEINGRVYIRADSPALIKDPLEGPND